MKNKDKKKRVPLYVPPALKDSLKEYAKSKRMTLEGLTELILVDFLKAPKILI